MAVGVFNSTLLGGYTPVCSECGVHLCWDISWDEYREAQKFWDNWRCRDCNPDYEGALKLFMKEKGEKD
ncbi:hypothetical protein [Geoalkalibacter subterraneus]|uniref:Uncharacterized protein n=1 Tax=Geoalkalibacter subterraneus TaxID=483547 RepID=A0A0B5FVL1_9BACT|nr:hypothetical protein [Geoalkalibacter subterraneus]AJF08205.1 hypothetical protein GSUB_17095 [Geoalkalibacter subterraneus]